MEYAIETLVNEKKILEKCLSEWESKNYPEAKKQREKRLSDLNEAIKVIEFHSRQTKLF